MHELGIVFHIIKSVEEIGKENSVESIKSVTLQIGEVAGVVNDYLLDCWKWAIKKSQILIEAQLKIEDIKAQTYCESCEGIYETVEFGKLCPYCGSENTYLIKGNEFMIKEIEVREAD